MGYKKLKTRLLFIMIFTFWLTNPVVSQEYNKFYESKKCLVQYRFTTSKGATYIEGKVVEKDNNQKIILNINIIIDKDNIGTITQPDGTFRLLLQDNKGKVEFVKTEYDSFKIKYKF